jgi:lysozyme family protein
MTTSDDRFDICLPFTLAQECPHPETWTNPKNFSNDAHDPGGETMCGIIQREYDSYRKHNGLLCRDVRGLTEREGKDIYWTSYWMPHCLGLPGGLDLQFFDASVNEGCVEAVRILQRVLGLDVDGLWGPKTTARVVAIQSRDVPAVIRAFTVRREAVYEQMKGFRYFGTDWLRRSKEIGDAALKMATGPT